MIARSVLPAPEDRGLVVVITLCSELPDIDVLFNHGNSLQGLQTHRGFTHSFFGAVLLALLVAFIVKKWFLRELHFRTLYMASLGGILIHIFFDWVTSYGTMLFHPFSKARFSLDILFIIDPYIWLILLIPLLLRWSKETLFYQRNLVGTIFLVFYLALGFLNHSVAIQRLEKWVQTQGIEPLSLGALPVPLSPLHQRGIVITREWVYDIPLPLFRSSIDALQTYPSPFRIDPYIQKAWQTEEGKIYRWFARFPLAEHKQDGLIHRIIFSDLRFHNPKESLGPIARRLADFLEQHNPELLDRRVFVLEIELTEEGEFQQAHFAD